MIQHIQLPPWHFVVLYDRHTPLHRIAFYHADLISLLHLHLTVLHFFLKPQVVMSSMQAEPTADNLTVRQSEPKSCLEHICYII